jgi:CHAT domain-containing protein
LDGRVRVLHIAAHGVLDLERPEQSFIALSDAPLTAEAVYNHDPGLLCELVVLSACQTGLGGLHPDSVIGLANAFLIAGANTVLGSLWQIPDVATAGLMRRFYADSAHGTEVPTALRAAQLALLNNPATEHPANWAAFKVVGRSASPLQDDDDPFSSVAFRGPLRRTVGPMLGGNTLVA